MVAFPHSYKIRGRTHIDLQGRINDTPQLPRVDVTRRISTHAQRNVQESWLGVPPTYPVKTRKYLSILLAECANLSSPPINKIARGHIDAQIPKTLGAEMAIIRSLHRGIGLVSLRVRLNV